MSPIKTFKSAPINPHSGASTTNQPQEQPQSQEPNQPSLKNDDTKNGNTNIPAWSSAAPTVALNSHHGGGYPAAKPGAYAVSAPTSSSSSHHIPPTKTYPSYAPETAQNSDSFSPPVPRPVGRPAAPSASPSASSSSSTTTTTPTKTAVPPPPKKGEPVQPPAYYAPRTTTTNNDSKSHGPYAISTYQAPQLEQSHYHYSQYAQPTSILDNNSFGQGDGVGGMTGQDILSTAKSWMASAGSKLAEAEEEVWRMVNSGTRPS